MTTQNRLSELERLQARLVEQAEKYEHYRAYIGEPPMNGNFISEAYWFIKKEVPGPHPSRQRAEPIPRGA
jgi:hypothetical protein